jgi:hypothetical protein
MNATKALGHVAKISRYDIRPCRGRIPAATSRQYQELYLSKTVTKEQRKNKKDVMNNKIADMQDWTVFSLAEGANSSSCHDKALATYNNQLNGGPLAVDCDDDDNNNSDSNSVGTGTGNGNGEGDRDGKGDGGGTRCSNNDDDNNNHALPVVINVVAIQRLCLCRAVTTTAAAGRRGGSGCQRGGGGNSNGASCNDMTSTMTTTIPRPSSLTSLS